MSVATVSILADVRKYVEEVSKIPGVTEQQAAKAGLKLEREMMAAQIAAARSARKAAAAVGDAAVDTNKKIAVLGDSLGKIGAIAGGGFDAIGQPVKEFGELLEVVDLRLLGVGIAAAALGGAMVLTAGSVLDAGRNIQAITEEARELGRVLEAEDVAALESLHEALRASDGAMLSLRVTMTSQLAPAATAVTEAMVGLVEVLGAGASAAPDGSTVSGALLGLGAVAGVAAVGAGGVGGLAGLAYRVSELVGSLRELGQETQRAADAERVAAEARDASALADLAAAEERLAEVERARTDAARDAERQRAEAAREAERRAKEAEAASLRLGEIERSVSVSMMDGYDRITAARDAQLAQIAELERVSGDHAAAEAARAVVMQQAQEALAEAREAAAARGIAAADAYAARQAQLHELESAAAARRAEEMIRAEAELLRMREAAVAAQQAAAMAAAASVSSLLGTIGAAAQGIIDTYDTTTEAGRQAARQGFAAMKAFALADVAVKTAQAVMNAFTFPTPVGVALGVAAAVAAGALQAGTIMAQQPSFHAGRLPATMHADEVTARVKRNEVVIPAPMVMAAGGPQEVRRRVEGEGGGVTVLMADFGDGRVMVPLRRAVSRRATMGPTGHWGG